MKSALAVSQPLMAIKEALMANIEALIANIEALMAINASMLVKPIPHKTVVFYTQQTETRVFSWFFRAFIIIYPHSIEQTINHSSKLYI